MFGTQVARPDRTDRILRVSDQRGFERGSGGRVFSPMSAGGCGAPLRNRAGVGCCDRIKAHDIGAKTKAGAEVASFAMAALEQGRAAAKAVGSR